MAYQLRQISPLDLKKSTAIGVKVPFSSPSAFTSVYTTKEQIKYNIINFLLTDKRERPLNPTFGAGLRSKIFEQISTETISDLQQSITNQVENNFPNVKVKDLNIIGDPNNSSINIKFSYVILSTSETDSANIVIQNA
jgi:phage baseplate assembly protein W